VETRVPEKLAVRAAPCDFVFDPAKTALLVVDMQRDLIEAAGLAHALGTDMLRLQQIVPTVAELLAVCRDEALMIVHAREAHAANALPSRIPERWQGSAPGRTFADESDTRSVFTGAEAGGDSIPALRPRSCESVINKPGRGAFYGTTLEDQLRNRCITHLILGGITTELCIQATIHEAADRGFHCLLIEDATEPWNPEFKAPALSMAMTSANSGVCTATFAEFANAFTKDEHLVGS